MCATSLDPSLQPSESEPEGTGDRCSRNPGSAGKPRTCGAASWLLLEDEGDALTVSLRNTPFDADAVVSDLRQRRHPNAEFVASLLTGQRESADKFLRNP